LGDAARRNALRWPSHVKFTEDIALMKHWTGERIQWLDHEIGEVLAKR
jgi:hypothetical protein